MKNKFILLLCIVLGASACKSTKETTTVALEKRSVEERLNRIIQSSMPYETLSSNLKLTIQTGEKNKAISTDAQLRIRKGEAIQLSLRIPILGSEALRIVITPDNLLIIDRLNKQYLFESMENIRKNASFDFDYYSLEALLTNQLFIAGKKEITPDDFSSFKIREEEYDVYLSNIDNQKIVYDFKSNFTDRIQSTVMSQEKTQSRVVLRYDDWGLASNKRTFPMKTNLVLTIPNSTYSLDFSYRNMDVDTSFSIEQNYPEKYKRITLSEVINLINNLL